MPERVHTKFDTNGHATFNKNKPSSVPAGHHKAPAGQPFNPGIKRKRPQHLEARPSDRLKARQQELLPVRKALPIWRHAHEIRGGLSDTSDVLVLIGETGSGKSTQVPQFLLSTPWCKGCIAITQPRRVAAVSLARRVAEEMGSHLGSSSRDSKVGYSVRFDTSVGPNTRVKFVTEGMLLQEMLGDPWLKKYSCVVVDEVHERSVNVDLLLGFLRRIVSTKEGRKQRKEVGRLKVVIMSATAEVKRLLTFFDRGFTEGGFQDSDYLWPSPAKGPSSIENAPAKPNREKHSNSVTNGHDGKKGTKSNGAGVGTTKPNGSASLKKSVKPDKAVDTSSSDPPDLYFESDYISVCHVEGRQYPVQTMYLEEPIVDFVEAALRAIYQTHVKEPLPGDILCFVTGQETVEALERLVNEYAAQLPAEVPKMLVLPLFAALPQTAQQKIFQPAPRFTRKIIIATNIAETSVTVSGVRYVVDCGKAKMKWFRNRLGLDSLLVKPISKSAAIQREGRAGREAAGYCYRLYTEDDYLKLEQNTVPEILRCDLAQAILTMKARHVEDIMNFPFLDQPPREALEKALFHLYQLGALDDNGVITDVGERLAKLPLTPRLGRVIVEAAKPDMDCLIEAIDIISALSVETIFLTINSEEKKEQAEEARKDFHRRQGDHLTLMAIVQAYAAEETDRRAWADRYFVSHRAMQNVMNIRRQLRQQCKHQKLLASIPDDKEAVTPYSEVQTEKILKCFLRGFASNTARIMPDKSYKTMVGNQTVAIHPSSVLFGKKVEAILYNEYVFTSKSYARGVSAVQMNWVGEALAV